MPWSFPVFVIITIPQGQRCRYTLNQQWNYSNFKNSMKILEAIKRKWLSRKWKIFSLTFIQFSVNQNQLYHILGVTCSNQIVNHIFSTFPVFITEFVSNFIFLIILVIFHFFKVYSYFLCQHRHENSNLRRVYQYRIYWENIMVLACSVSKTCLTP